MNNVSGAGSASQTIYIPTQAELAAMTFTSVENKAAYSEFLSSDKYLSNHRGEYMRRGAIAAPFINRINLRVAQDFYFAERSTLSSSQQTSTTWATSSTATGVSTRFSAATPSFHTRKVYTTSPHLYGRTTTA